MKRSSLAAVRNPFFSEGLAEKSLTRTTSSETAMSIGQWNALEPQCFRTGDLRIVSGQGLSPVFLKVIAYDGLISRALECGNVSLDLAHFVGEPG